MPKFVIIRGNHERSLKVVEAATTEEVIKTYPTYTVIRLPYDMTDHLRKQAKWSAATFGPGKRLHGVLNHIRKELGEIEKQPEDLYEWIDVVILALDGAWRAGYSPEAILYALIDKMERNYNRKWPDWRLRSEDEAIEHTDKGDDK